MSRDDAAQAAQLKDISRSGMCCYLGEPMTEMTMLRVQLQLPGDPQLHAVQGVVVRCEKRRGSSPPSYEIAVYFTDMEAAARRAIHGYVLSQIQANLSE